MARPRPSAIIVATPVNGWSAAVGALPMSLSFGIFCSRVGREGGVGGAACLGHTPRIVRFVVRLRAPAALEAADSGAYEVDG